MTRERQPTDAPRRRMLIAGGLAFVAGVPFAARFAGAQHHAPLYERLREPGRIGLPEITAQQWVADSPAPAAAAQGRWNERAPL
ncbi:MAG TPA: hypothetical protein VM491_22400, partial [Burkholderiaceae bacterium]|nr:hypothetical protein [Burkholderiaceae bacterium]